MPTRERNRFHNESSGPRHAIRANSESEEVENDYDDLLSTLALGITPDSQYLN